MEQNNLLKRGIDVLEILEKSKGSLSSVEIQKILKIPKTTLYRILKTLIEKRLIIYENRKYKLGYGFLKFSKKILADISLREIVNPYLKKICEYTQETVELIIPDNDAILYIDKIESPQSIKLIAQIGSRYNTLHASAPGKILLAYDNKIFESFFEKKKIEKITPKTITNKDRLKREIEKIREIGWAYDDGEARIDVRRIAAPIFNYEGKLIGIIGIAGPSYRINDRKIKEFGKFLKEICDEISEKVGYKKEG